MPAGLDDLHYKAILFLLVILTGQAAKDSISQLRAQSTSLLTETIRKANVPRPYFIQSPTGDPARRNRMSESTPAGSDSVDVKKTPDSNNSSTNPKQPARSDSVSSAHPNQRSCVTCRRRKVRCDKIHPSCTNCNKAGIECVFPGPGRAKRKTRKPQDAELLARLKKLEGVIQSLGAQVEEDKGTIRGPSVMPSIQGELEAHREDGIPQNGDTGPQRRNSSIIDKQLGRLVINEGRSRYVSNSFWASMGDEMAEMRDILDPPSSEDEEDISSPDQSNPGSSHTSHQGFIFGYSSMMNTLRTLHPSPSQLFGLMLIFEENVDPVVKILHRPTTRSIIMKASSNTDTLSKSEEALLFSIYYGAVCSLTPVQCEKQLGEDKEQLSNRFRFAVEQALARANFLNSSSLMVLQAFVMFLICVRTQDDTRLVWSLSGLTTHLAQALGVHRDGTNFGLSPFETEMRRRLWWHICLLDTRAAEDHGADPSFTEAFYDARLPLNINDDDISPETKETPKERQGTTEMTFCLIRFELSAASRRMNFAGPGLTPCGFKRPQKTLKERERMIEETHKRIDALYLQYCDMTVPIYWVSATVGRLVLAKMWLMAHHPLQYTSSDEKVEFSQGIRDRLFVTSVEIIEFACLLENNENTAKWGWLFRTYMQWHAVAFVLSELCHRPPGPDYERAWKAVESVYDDRLLHPPKTQSGMLWKPMRQLMAKAKAIREKYRKSGVGVEDPSKAMKMETQQNGPWQISSPSQCEVFNPGAPPIHLHQHLEAFGLLDGTAAADLQEQPLTNNIALSQGMPTPAQRNFTDDDISQWLAQEQMMQPDPSFYFAGWNVGIQNIGDVPMSTAGFDQIPPTEGVQRWF